MKYPKYRWEQDLRRRVSKKQVVDIQCLYLMGERIVDISKELDIPMSTLRYWLNRDKELIRIRTAYWNRKKSGTLPKKPQERIRKCMYRKLMLCPKFKKWLKEYGKKYRRSSNEMSFL